MTSIIWFKMQLLAFFVFVAVSLAGCQSMPHNLDNSQNNIPQLTESCIFYRDQARKSLLKGNRSEAREQFENAIKTGCGEVEIRREMAEMYTWNDQFDLAEEQYKKILAVDGTDLRGHSALARLYIEKIHNYQKGIEELTKVDKLLSKENSAGRIGADRLWGKAHDGLGNKALAIKYYERYLKGLCSKIPDSTDCVEISLRVKQLK